MAPMMKVWMQRNFTIAPLILRYPSLRSDGVGGASGYIFVVDNGSFEAPRWLSAMARGPQHLVRCVDQGKMMGK